MLRAGGGKQLHPSARIYRFPVRRAITLIEKDFPMVFVDTSDDVFLGEKS